MTGINTGNYMEEHLLQFWGDLMVPLIRYTESLDLQGKIVSCKAHHNIKLSTVLPIPGIFDFLNKFPSLYLISKWKIVEITLSVILSKVATLQGKWSPSEGFSFKQSRGSSKPFGCPQSQKCAWSLSTLPALL